VPLESTVAVERRGSLGATPMPMRPSPSGAVGSPCVSWRHVVPPSVDLKRPLPGPVKTPFSHGAWRDSQSAA
jgi:hypothetical protein